MTMRLLSLESVNALRAKSKSVDLLPATAERVSSIACIRRSPNCPMAAKRAMRTVNAMPNFSPMRLVFKANSRECPLRPGYGVGRRIFQEQPRETMLSLRCEAFEMRRIATTCSKPRSDELCLCPKD